MPKYLNYYLLKNINCAILQDYVKVSVLLSTQVYKFYNLEEFSLVSE